MNKWLTWEYSFCWRNFCSRMAFLGWNVFNKTPWAVFNTTPYQMFTDLRIIQPRDKIYTGSVIRKGSAINSKSWSTSANTVWYQSIWRSGALPWRRCPNVRRSDLLRLIVSWCYSRELLLWGLNRFHLLVQWLGTCCHLHLETEQFL